MQCLWPRRGATAAIALAVLVHVTAASSDAIPSLEGNSHASILAWEQKLRRAPVHSSDFAPVYRAVVVPDCANVRTPEALLTPDPSMPDLADESRIQVSFIIGADGRVHSAFIIRSGGLSQDGEVLRALRHWRYRPALCNGVPMDTEAQVSFMPR